MRRRLLTMLTFIGLLWLPTQAQILKPVKWTFEARHVEDKQYELIFKAKIDDGWNIYSQYLESDDGPIRTSFAYESPADLKKIGKNKEESPKRKEGHDEMFGMNVVKFGKSATFTQRVEVLDASQPVTGYLEFMACDAKQCLPPTEVDFEINLPAAEPATEPTPAPNPETGTPKPESTDDTETPKQEAPAPVPDTKPSGTSKPEPASKIGTKPKPEKPAPEAKKKPAPDKPKADKNEKKGKKTTQVPKKNPNADLKEPVKWNYSTERIAEGQYRVILHADVAEGWTTYSQFTSEDGPVPTSVVWEKNAKANGKAKEISDYRSEGLDDFFGVTVIKFKKSVDFVQEITVDDPTKPVDGFVEFMACDATKCLPPAEAVFKIDLGKANNNVTFGGSEAPSQPTTTTNPTGYETAGQNTPNEETFDKSRVGGDCSGETGETEERSYWQTFVKGIFGGLLALLTPCVFPMIPLTVSYFLKGSKDKKKGFRDAIIYGLAIIVLYTGLGTVITSISGAGALNAMASNPWFNLALAILLFVFALSFFGYFEIQLPSKWVDSTDAVADKGGLLGILGMAATLALVSFSCTGPLIGVLLVDAVSQASGTGIPIEPIVGMFGFSVALALPFALFAAFPSWLSSLPKSGGWMDDVKVSVGFLEVALSLKFLAVFSLIMQHSLGGIMILPYEAFVAIWVIIAILWAAYMMGWFKFKKDPYASAEKVGRPVTKTVLGLMLFGLAAWNMMGFKTTEAGTFHPTYIMSGLAPPSGHSYIKPSVCPHAIDCQKDYFAAKELAKQSGKPLFIDFTGYSCENCRRNEESVWPKPGIIEKLRENYVVVSLYVDEREALPERFESSVNNRVRTVGQRWADFQIIHMGSNTQPLYVLSAVNKDNTATILNDPMGGLIQNSEDFKTFLQCGIDVHGELQAAGTAY